MSGLWGVPDTWATTPGPGTELTNLHLAAQVQHERALTQQEMLNAKKTAMEITADQEVARRMQSMGNGGDEESDPISMIMDVGQSYIKAGAVNKGIGIVEKGVQAQGHLASAALANARGKKLESDAQNKAISDLVEMTADVTGPEDWAIRQMMWMNKNPGKPLPPAFRTYNPEIISAISQTSKRALEDRKLQQKDDVEKERVRADKVREHQAEVREKHREAQRDVMNQWRATREQAAKNGGKVERANTLEVRQAQKLVLDKYPDLEGDTTQLIKIGGGKDSFDTSVLSVDLAETAKSIQATNRGLSYSEALQKAMDTIESSGVIKSKTEEIPKTFGIPGTGGTKTKTTYSGIKTGGTSTNPLPITKGMAMKDKTWYVSNGKVGQYDATTGKMTNVSAARLSSGGMGSEDDSEDDDGNE